jgi:DNA-binding MarR family transcriptional regulator
MSDEPGRCAGRCTSGENPAAQTPLTAEELGQWRGFVGWSEGIVARVSQALLETTGISRTEFTVLVRLSETGGASLQLELQEYFRWSPSRLSHLLRRMEARVLLRRRNVGLGRAVHVELTQAGRDAVDRATVVHAAVVRDAFLRDLPESLAGFFLQEYLKRLGRGLPSEARRPDADWE